MKVVCSYGLLQMSELLKHQAELNSQLQDWSQDIQQEPLACHQLCEVVLRRLRALELMVHRNTQALSDLRSHVSQWCPAWASSLSLQHRSSWCIEIQNLSPSTLACVISCIWLFCIVYMFYSSWRIGICKLCPISKVMSLFFSMTVPSSKIL